MKRTTLILLTLVYLLSTTGVAVNRFYCCGKLAVVNISYEGSDNNESKPDKKKDDCCKNVKQTFKIKDNHISSASVSLGHPVPVILSGAPGFELAEVVRALPAISLVRANEPPERDLVPLYTLNCTYRI